MNGDEEIHNFGCNEILQDRVQKHKGNHFSSIRWVRRLGSERVRGPGGFSCHVAVFFSILENDQDLLVICYTDSSIRNLVLYMQFARAGKKRVHEPGIHTNNPLISTLCR